jgi:hypothetical protein
VVSDTWERKRDLPFMPRLGAFGVTYNGKGYLGGGFYIDSDGYQYRPTNLYEYDTDHE